MMSLELENSGNLNVRVPFLLVVYRPPAVAYSDLDFLIEVTCPEYLSLSFVLLLPGSCGKSVVFPHLVGFHSSRQNIY